MRYHDTAYKEALVNTIEDMYPRDEVNYARELATAGIMVLAIVAVSVLVLTLN